MEKIVIVINGVGGVGKDTICEIISMHYSAKKISAIDPIKQIAAYGGWEYSDKSFKGRKLLSDIKLAFIEYNDFPLTHLLHEYSAFLKDPNEILLVHIREPDEIEKFISNISSTCITLLITSDRLDSIAFGNESDDNVTNFNYDYTYRNILPLAKLEDNFMLFFTTIMAEMTESSI